MMETSDLRKVRLGKTEAQLAALIRAQLAQTPSCADRGIVFTRLSRYRAANNANWNAHVQYPRTEAGRLCAVQAADIVRRLQAEFDRIDSGEAERT
jgi:hypothetical protein